MDVFQTITTGATIIYQFLDGYSSASEHSRSLAARLNWDLRVIRQFTDYYEKRAGDDGTLSPEDSELLETSAAYLSNLATRISSICQRLESRNRFRKELNKALWWHREDSIRDLEQELFEWTTRLDLRLVGLPTEVKTVIQLDDQAYRNSPNFAASQNILALKAVTQKADQAMVHNIFCDGQMDENPGTASTTSYDRFQAVKMQGTQVLIERRFHNFPKDSYEWKELKRGLVRLASALNCLDGTTVSLLRCDRIYHNDQDPLATNFSLASSLPFPVGPKFLTLKSCINKTQGTVRLPPSHPLSERFSLALSIATAVFFLHSVGSGFLHHNVTSHNILMLYRRDSPSANRFPHSLGTPFLVGFEAVKEFHTLSDLREVIDTAILYQHPDRLLETGRPKYSAIHDIYSLGMVLLEIALWKPLERYDSDLLDACKREDRILRLLEMANVSMGARYRNLVEWCLSLKSGSKVDSLRLSKQVIEPLEEILSSIS